ncbi:MAG TPA: pilin [Patescibacteria group bacterium]|nr:pilin [Patescibacteria group bacterium]
MKLEQKILISFTLLTIFVLSTIAVLATDDSTPAATLNLTDKLKNVGLNAGFQQTDDKANLPEMIGSIIQGFLTLLGVIFMAYIIYGGYVWLTARGNEENISKAKAIIRGSITGIIIVLAAYAITAFVVGRLIKSTGYQSPPDSAGQGGQPYDPGPSD